MRCRTASLLAWIGLVAPLGAQDGNYLDLAPFGRVTATAEAGLHTTTVEWDDERDVREIRARYSSTPPSDTKVEYWFRTWPYPPPHMPTMEDPVDDLWQGKWLTAQSVQSCQASECIYTFSPLTEQENPLARNLPGTRYRRALKVRLVYAAATALASPLQIFSESKRTPLKVRVELGRGETGVSEWSGSVEVLNGLLRSAQPWQFEAGDALD